LKLVFINNSGSLIKCPSYWAIVTPHKKTDISHLVMGDFQNYAHHEITVSIIEGRIYIRQCTVYNNHVKTGGCQYPYDPNGTILGLKGDTCIHELVQQLIHIQIGVLKRNPKDYTFLDY